MTKDRPLVVMRVLGVSNFLSLPGTVLLLVLKTPHLGTPFSPQQTGLVGQPWKMQIPRYFWLSGQRSWFPQFKVSLLKEITGSDHTQPVDEHRDTAQGTYSPLGGAQTHTLIAVSSYHQLSKGQLGTCRDNGRCEIEAWSKIFISSLHIQLLVAVKIPGYGMQIQHQSRVTSRFYEESTNT